MNHRSKANPEFEALLTYLKHSQGCDLTGYKRVMLMRRFQHRMHSLNIQDYQSYLQYLQSHSKEYLPLLDDVLINVTSFFRDRAAWDYLETEVIPKLIASKQPNEPIRVWSAGCAAGQEIYSILILLAEALDLEFCLARVQGYATDVDTAAIQQARRATYSVEDVTGIPTDLLEKYFERTQQGYVFNSALRRSIVFGRHDLINDAPMPKIDLLLCRNVLIYFEPEVQAAILVRFHFALQNPGFLFLGNSETLMNRREIFTPLNLKHRIYTKGLNLEVEDHLAIIPKSRNQMRCARQIAPSTLHNFFWQTAFKASPVAQFAIARDGRLMAANEQATQLFGLTLDDWNRPFQDLEPGKLLGKNAAIKSYYRDRHPVTLRQIEWNTSQSKKYFDIAIAPVFDTKQQWLGIIVSFLETTTCKQLAEKLEFTDSKLASVSQTLQTTEAELDATRMELEVAYQEIQLLAQTVQDSDEQQ